MLFLGKQMQDDGHSQPAPPEQVSFSSGFYIFQSCTEESSSCEDSL